MKEKIKNDEKNYAKEFKISLGVIAALIIIIIVLLILLLRINIRYFITFDSNGGSHVCSIVVKKNDLAIEPEDPTRENYVFAGWYYNDELFDFSKPITKDMELEARWVATGKVIGVEFEQKDLTLTVGDSMKLNAIVKPEDALDKTLIWESSNPKVVSVDENGNIKALKTGTAIIKVTTKDGSYTAEIKITVNKKVEEEKEVETSSKVEKPTTSNKPSTPSVPSEPSTPNVPSEPSTPNVPSEPSTPNVPSEPSVPSTPSTINVTGVSLNKTSLNLYVNDTSKLIATVKPDNATNKEVTWSSSNPNVVTVDSNGNIKAISEGKATITVKTKDGGYTATCDVTVNKRPDNYVVTFTAKPMEGTGSLMQYAYSVTKNGAPCSYNMVIYNGNPLDTYASEQQVSNKNGAAKIVLTDGTQVTATSVVFK